MKSQPEIAGENIARIRQLLAEWLVASADSRGPVAEILKLLEPLDSYVREELSRPASARKKPQDGGSGRGGGTTYTVSKQKNEVEMLTEHREGGSSQPYRVPKVIYDAVVAVLAEADSPMEFEAVMDAVAKLRMNAPDWQVRAVLRFLLNANPPLIARERNRYRAEDGSLFASEAKKLWRAVAKSS